MGLLYAFALFLTSATLVGFGSSELSTSTTTPKIMKPGKVEIAFPHSVPLNFDQTVFLRWKVDKTTMTLQLIAPTTGWIGLGFSHTSSMFGADLLIMGKTTESTYAIDTYSEENGVPEVDEKQDVNIVSGWENGTHTMVTVTRQLVTCDKDDMSIKEGTYRVIWAYGQSDVTGNLPMAYDYHSRNRGAKSLKLINPITKEGKKDASKEEIKHFDVRATNTTVPDKDTFYLCKLVKLPESTEDYHVTGYDPYITPGNERNLHHMIVYLCYDGVEKQLTVGEDFECAGRTNSFAIGCVKVLAGWAIGMTMVRYPSRTGFPLGGTSHPKYVLLETHYDNPEVKEFQDSSGIRFFYTENRRELDVGILMVSQLFNSIWIPPDMEKYTVTGHCSEACISRGMETSQLKEVNVIAVALHSHLAGRALKLRQYRKGVEMEPLARDEHYDFDYQEVQYLEDGEAKLKPGDELAMQCDYGTLGRKNITLGGLGTKNEMCIAFVFHYPALKLDHCSTWPKLLESPRNYIGLATLVNLTMSPLELTKIAAQIRRNRSGSVWSVLNQVEWTDENKKIVEQYMANLNRLQLCAVGKKRLMGFLEAEFSVSKYDEYVEDKECKSEDREQPQNFNFAVLAVVATTVLIFVLAMLTEGKT